ncbi:ABC transporter ATP-binding protein [Endomicrobium proavitum]|uniref:ABC transporter ATP-binding protein n=1 Tax=Endomicrobium proavitum TaxID=1408281 RepID=UPI0006985969|nr:dipeptide/oligopeptide/nickel ABC transporter ATP-binding protein [Endomicrobium proavitum]
MLLEVKKLSKIYSEKSFFKESRFLALNKVSFNLQEGESLSIIGSSGCGKTTLGKILANIISFDLGSVRYLGEDLKKYPVARLSETVQMVFQNPYASLDPKLKIKSSLLEAFGNKKPADADKIMADTLKSVGLDAKILNNYPHQFSGGQRQRVAIARVLIKKPKLIIADEPFASLDIYSQNQITDIFKNIIKTTNTSIILITHDISAAAKFAKRMIIINEGKIIKDDTVKKVFAEKKDKYIVNLFSSTEF